MSKRRRWLGAAAAATVLAASSGCGGGSAAKVTAPAPALTFWTWSSSPVEQTTLSDLVDIYNKRGRATVTLQVVPEFDPSLDTGLASSDPPDLFYLNDNKVGELAKAGKIVPYGNKIANADDIYPALRKSFTVDGTLYCAPKDFSTLQLVYDTDAFAAAGITAPPKTWEELKSVARKLTQPGRPGLVNSADFYRWGVFMAQAGAWPTNEDSTKMTMDTPEMRTALQYIADGLKGGYFAMASSVGATWGGEALGKNKAAMTIEGNWISGAMKTDYPNVHWASAELPAGPKGKATMTFSVCLGVSKASKHQAEAIDFVNYLTTAEQQLTYTKFGAMPSRQSVAEQWQSGNPTLAPFVTAVSYARSSVIGPGFTDVKGTIDDGLAKLAQGSKSIDEVIATTQEAGKRVTRE